MDITEQRALADDLRRTTTPVQRPGRQPAGRRLLRPGPTRPTACSSTPAPASCSASARTPPPAWNISPTSIACICPMARPSPLRNCPSSSRCAAAGRTMRDDIVVHRPDGRRVPLVTWAAPVDLGRAPEANAAVWVLEDLTALHQAEAARHDTEVRLRAIIETMARA